MMQNGRISIHPVEGQPPQLTSSVHRLAGTSEHPDSIVLGNHEESLGVQEISINYVVSRESFDRKTTTVDIYFAQKIADILITDHDPSSIVECQIGRAHV